MWYYSSSQDNREQPPTSEVGVAVEPNPRTVRPEAEPGEPSLSADEPPRPAANIPPIRPGSEYWLP